MALSLSDKFYISRKEAQFVAELLDIETRLQTKIIKENV